MAMNEIPLFALALMSGMLLGVFFFGGLWWTVNNCVASKHPAVLFFVSWILRMTVVLSGFYFVGRDQWQRLVICLLGFLVARLVVMRLTRKPAALQTSAASEASHAS
jgi:F1F0 ATPase subunit 2